MIPLPGNYRQNRFRIPFSFAYLCLFAFLTLNVSNNLAKWEKLEFLHYDVCGYHNYLPAVFIYHDLDHFRFMDSIKRKYDLSSVNRYALYDIESTGKVCNQYPIGVAIFQAPFFLIAHAICSRSSVYPADGYSSPYQHATLLSTWLFVMLGLFILRKFLLAYFDDKIVLITLIMLTIGTNLYVYTVQEPGLSHPYLFFLFACILYLTQLLYQKPSWLNAILLGVCIGLCAITRPLDALVFLIPLFWTTEKVSGTSKRTFLYAHKFKLLVLILFVIITIFPQLVYWKSMTGDWLHYSYADSDYFQFKQFNLLKGLFSYRKGWFLYSPLMMLGFIGALLMLRSKELKFYALPFWVFFIPMIYLVFSWHMWTYGWSFSCRALVETLPLLALPMCVVIKQLFAAKLRYVLPVWTILFLLLTLSAFQTWQYTESILPGDAVNKKYYWKIFGKTKVNKSELDLIMKEQRALDYQEGNGL